MPLQCGLASPVPEPRPPQCGFHSAGTQLSCGSWAGRGPPGGRGGAAAAPAPEARGEARSPAAAGGASPPPALGSSGGPGRGEHHPSGGHPTAAATAPAAAAAAETREGPARGLLLARLEQRGCCWGRVPRAGELRRPARRAAARRQPWTPEPRGSKEGGPWTPGRPKGLPSGPEGSLGAPGGSEVLKPGRENAVAELPAGPEPRRFPTLALPELLAELLGVPARALGSPAELSPPRCVRDLPRRWSGTSRPPEGVLCTTQAVL